MSSLTIARRFMGPSIHPRLKLPVGQRLALGALQAAYRIGEGVTGGTIAGCTMTNNIGPPSILTLKFKMPGNRKLKLRKYNMSNPENSATSLQITNKKDGTSRWVPVHIRIGPVGSNTITVDWNGAPSVTATAIRYAWGGTEMTNDPLDSKNMPNGKDVTCCEGNGVDTPCMMAQCPLLADEPLAPFGGLPVDPFVAKLVDGKCLCPEPQVCDL